MIDDPRLAHVTYHNELHQMRKHMGLTQGQMADRMGLSKSAYVAVESGTATLRKIHLLAAERITLAHAAENQTPLCVNNATGEDAMRYSRSMAAMQKD